MSEEPEPWQIALEQLRQEYKHLVPWRSATELQDEVVWAYTRLEETYRRVRKERAVKYYQEYTDEGKHTPWNNQVLAVLEDKTTYGAIGPNGEKDMCGKAIAAGALYLEEYCREITEQEARQLHPELFVYLHREGLI